MRSLWFEEGDGVALYENDELLAVIPGWADMTRAMPGYSRDAIGETPFAWSLEEASEGLAPRLDKARAYWEWRGGDGAWASFQQFVMGHLDRAVGSAGRFWDAGGGRLPTVGITERPPERGRRYSILSTVGMSCQRMPTVEQYIDRPDAYARVELAVATPATRGTPPGCSCGWASTRGTRSPGSGTATPPAGTTGRRPSRSAPPTAASSCWPGSPGCPTCRGSPSAGTPCSGSG
nr:hypothetical protein GCM10020093_099960 [Planobispora longispora]